MCLAIFSLSIQLSCVLFCLGLFTSRQIVIFLTTGTTLQPAIVKNTHITIFQFSIQFPHYKSPNMPKSANLIRLNKKKRIKKTNCTHQFETAIFVLVPTILTSHSTSSTKPIHISNGIKAIQQHTVCVFPHSHKNPIVFYIFGFDVPPRADIEVSAKL